jgi:hypothetical protein
LLLCTSTVSNRTTTVPKTPFTQGKGTASAAAVIVLAVSREIASQSDLDSETAFRGWNVVPMVLGELDADGLWGGWDNMVGDGGMGVNAVQQH